MTTTFAGNQAVQAGYYFNAIRWTIEPVAQDGARLSAGPASRAASPPPPRCWAPPSSAWPSSMFLPFIGFMLVAQVALAPVGRFLQAAAVGLTATYSPSYAVGAAHLTGQAADQGGIEAQGPPAATALRMLAAPFLGLAFVVTLPIVAAVVVVSALLKRITGQVADGASELAATVTPDVATGAAYLGGKEGSKATEAGEHPELDALAKELEQKRRS